MEGTIMARDKYFDNGQEQSDDVESLIIENEDDFPRRPSLRQEPAEGKKPCATGRFGHQQMSRRN